MSAIQNSKKKKSIPDKELYRCKKLYSKVRERKRKRERGKREGGREARRGRKKEDIVFFFSVCQSSELI